MTWGKFGTEYRGQIMMAGLSDAAFRTHTEAHLWLYEVESRDLRIPKRLVRTFAGSPDYETAIKELVDAGWWADEEGSWLVLHHADVYRQALAAQLSHREKEKNRQRAKRRKVAPDVGANVGSSVGTNVGATQSVSQSTRSVGPVLRSREDFAGEEPAGEAGPGHLRAARAPVKRARKAGKAA